ncbi:MAG: hypothetical protein ACE148_14965 [Vicinamibacterales bacterium]
MKRSLLVAAAMAASVVVAAAMPQAGDVNSILAAARAALGGEQKLAAVKTVLLTGSSTRVVGESSSAPGDAEVAIELPDKFARTEVQDLGGFSLTRTRGFNGSTPIDIVDQPPAAAGRVMIRIGPGGGLLGQEPTPEQREQQKARLLSSNRQDFARFTLGFLLSSPQVYPLRFAYGGVAESPDGRADIIDVTGEDGFALRLFIDQSTHLPLMASWMARESLRITTTMRAGPGGAAPAGATGHATAAGAPARQLTPEEREKLMRQLEEQRKEAEAKLRVVEHRIYYGDYREADGIKVPFRLQYSIDGKPTEELVFDRVQVNRKIDPKKFEPGK